MIPDAWKHNTKEEVVSTCKTILDNNKNRKLIKDKLSELAFTIEVN